jgi:hypothetical protein
MVYRCGLDPIHVIRTKIMIMALCLSLCLIYGLFTHIKWLCRIKNRLYSKLHLSIPKFRQPKPSAFDIALLVDQLGLALQSGLNWRESISLLPNTPLGKHIKIIQTQLDQQTPWEKIMNAHATLSPIITLWHQSVHYGYSPHIIQDLNALSADYRDNALCRLEEQQARLAIWLMMPLMLCFLPALMLVLIGPLIQDLISQWQVMM